jgi:hypothetical protein
MPSRPICVIDANCNEYTAIKSALQLVCTMNRNSATEASKIKKSWFSRHLLEIVIGIVGLAFMLSIFFAKAFRETYTIDRASAGQFGDFVGGFFGTAFTLASIVLLYVTLRNQRHSFQLQSFEARYFELVKMHRDNVAELALEMTTGRRVFILLIREFREILSVADRIRKMHRLPLTQLDLLHVSYNCLFFGTGPNSSRMLKMSLATFDPAFINALEQELTRESLKAVVQAKRKLGYVPFEGHQSRLGHYYRHLFQTVHFVDQQEIEIHKHELKDPDSKKYEYVKTIRAQLTTHEQALLLINSLVPLGQDWWRKDLIVKYRMVQNLPQDFFDGQTELNVNQLFPPGYFEWEEYP